MLKKIRRILFYFLNIIFVTLVAACMIFFYFGRSLPSEFTLLNYAPPTTTRIYSADKTLIEEYATERRIIVKFDKIPNIVKQAFLIAEDKDFYNHSGISIQSLLRALIENTSKKSWGTKPAGGSTITQQVAKNLLVGNKRSLTRKIQEAIMAFRIEASISKDKIFEIYLNHIYLGKGCYGIIEACNYYFYKNIEDITPDEAAFLASLTSAPSVYCNIKDNSKILTKRNAILSQMYESDFITRDQLLKAISKPISITLRKTKFSAPFFSEEVHKICTQYVSDTDFFNGGYSITTTMNSNMQKIATKCLEDGLIEHEKTKTWNGPLESNDLKEIEKNLPRTLNKIFPVTVLKNINESYYLCKDSHGKNIEINSEYELNDGDTILCRECDNKKNIYELYQSPDATGAIIVMDADNGDILAMSGGYSFDINSFNCATQAKRQAGSTIKPFVYAAALESGMDEYDEIEDKPITIKLENGTYYSPSNYSKKIYGKMQMRNGLIYSRNLATINLAYLAGLTPISKLLQKLDLAGNNFQISYVLGSYEVTLMQLVSAFSIFLNNGKLLKPNFIKEITQQIPISHDLKNRIFKKTELKQIISPETASTIKNMLRDTAKFGTANMLAKTFSDYNIDVGGKTGTTNDFKDAWFIGYITKGSQTLIVGVFVGYKNPRSLGEHASGSKIALPIFFNFLKQFCKN